MAAVTFTRKAASELRGRFQLALEKRLRKRPSPDRAARVRAALSNLERFFAGTIHSFCARLLRERPVEAGVSPGFTELDEMEDLELRRRAWRDYIANARSAGDPVMMELLEAGVKPNDLDSAFSTHLPERSVEFQTGDGAMSRMRRSACEGLDKFWKISEATSGHDRRCHDLPDTESRPPVSQPASHRAASARSTGRNGIAAGPVEIRGSITQKRWATSRPRRRG